MSKFPTTDHLTALFEAFNRHDIGGIMVHLAPACVFEGVAGPEAWRRRFDTPEVIAAASSGVWSTIPDAEWLVHGHFISGDRAVSQWLFYGTQADGQRIEAEGVDLFSPQGGLITHKNTFRKQRPLLLAA